MEKDTFYKDTFVLTISNLAMAVIRFIFSIMLSEKLGAEGVGLYGLVMPIYDLFCCLVCGGIVASVSKEVSIFYGTSSYKNMKKSVRITVAFSVIWSIFITLIMFIFSPFVSKYIIKDMRILYSLWVLSPALVFISISSVYKGYFFGVVEVNTPAIIDIVEKTMRMFITLTLIEVLMLRDITKTVTATYASFAIGEFVSFILLFIYYRKSIRKFEYITPYKKEEVENGPQLLYNTLSTAFPLGVNGLLTTIISSVSTLIVPYQLVKAGFTHNMALESIGKFSGMALTIVFFPMVIVASMSTILVPDLSKSLTKKDYTGIEHRINEVIKMCFILGLCITIIGIVIPKNLGMLFYKRDDLGTFIKAAALSAPFLYASSCTYGILNGLGKQKEILVNSVLTALIELILIYVLIRIPFINIMGYAIALFASSFIGFIINLKEIRKSVELYSNVGEIAIVSALTIIIGLILNILNIVLPNDIFIVKNIILITIGFSLFFLCTFTIKKTS